MSLGTVHNNYPSNNGVPVVTTDAAVTLLMSHDFTPDSACQVNIRVVCRNPATGDAKAWHWEAVAKRFGAGTPSLSGSVLKLLDGVGDAGLASAAIAVQALASGNVRVGVTGIAATTLEWWGEFSALCIENP